MAGFPIGTPRFRAFDVNGDPLAGGLLYAYSAGTTTPRDTFTTRALSVANANPVVLNANGEADVWLTTGVEYKFILKDSAGVTQWTVDNVPSTADALLPDGSVTAPALAFASDINTGLYLVAQDQLGVAVGGLLVATFTGTTVDFRFGEFSSAGLDLSGATTNPASTTAFTNTVTPKNVAKAWAKVLVTSAAAVTVKAGFNIASAALNAGELQITFASAFTSTDEIAPIVHETVSGGTAYIGNLYGTRIISTTQIGIQVLKHDGTTGEQFGLTRDITVAVVIFGAQ